MRLLISGSNGFIGNACCAYFEEQGHEVVRLVRKKTPSKNTIFWDPTTGNVQKEDFEDFDAIIHLAGENIAQGRWTKKRKQKIFLSRCRDTWLLSEVLRRLYRPPKTLITASAVGYYGNRGNEELTEKSSEGSGFLADLCGKWESATSAIERRGVRVIQTRLGIVLSSQGGLLKKMKPMILGDGKQYVSWIALKDLLKIFEHLLSHDKIEGPVNAVAPDPVRQENFVYLMAKSLKKGVWLKIPAFLLRLIFGQMADEVLLSSQKVYPCKLLESGYLFDYSTLDMYFLGKPL